MGGKKAIERLEKAQRWATEIFRRMGHKPTDGDMARAILLILDDVDKAKGEVTDDPDNTTR